MTYHSRAKRYSLSTRAYWETRILDIGAGDVFALRGEKTSTHPEFRIGT